MPKRLSILLTTLLLAACSGQGGDQGSTAPQAPASGTAAASTAPATPAAEPAQPSTASAPVAAASTGEAPAAAASAPAAATAQPPAANSADAAAFKDDGTWVEGRDYERIQPVQPKVTTTDKVEVVEVFSYGCPACNAWHLTADKLAASLPDNAVMVYLPAAFRPDENWVVYQRAFYAAEALGVAAKSHDAMFDATWKTGETATYDLSAGRPKPRSQWPGLEDIAKFYARYGVKPEDFVGVANSFSVNTKMKRADELVKDYGVAGTPTIVVNGTYRFSPLQLGPAKSIALARWLVAKIAAGR